MARRRVAQTPSRTAAQVEDEEVVFVSKKKPRRPPKTVPKREPSPQIDSTSSAQPPAKKPRGRPKKALKREPSPEPILEPSPESVTESDVDSDFSDGPIYLPRLSGREPQWRRIVRFLPHGRIGIDNYTPGEPVDPDIDIGLVKDFDRQTVLAKTFWTWDMAELDYADVNSDEEEREMAISELLPIFLEDMMCGSPVMMPEMAYCVGVNYKSFASHSGQAIPAQPSAILRPATAIGFHEEYIVIPEGFATSEADYEAHLAVVLRNDCRDIDPEDAKDEVFGILAASQVVLRNNPWKSFDGCCALGPVMVNADTLEEEDWNNIEVTGELNGEIVQKSTLADMAFSVAQIISSLSRGNTLKQGTVILTG